MKYNITPAFPAIALACTKTCHVAGLIRKTSKVNTKFSKLLLILFSATFIFLYHLTAFSYDYGSGVKIVNSDASGVVLELGLENLAIDSREFDNKNYHLISYKDCGFTTDIGKPKLPVSRAFIGLPASASVSVNILDSAFTNISGYTPIPVPDKIQRKSPDGVDVLADEFTIDRNFYLQNAFYPKDSASIIYDGYVRNQRVVFVELHPVQYNPATKSLRKYTKLTLRVNFSNIGDINSRSLSSPLEFMNKDYLSSRSDKDFEKLYEGLLTNYEDARQWRKLRPKTSFAPSMAKQNDESEAYKLLISKSGIYRLDYSTLEEAGLDLTNLDPRTLKLRFQDKQVPIYVSGEADGRFDQKDYIEFYAPDAKNIYTRWNIYWLNWGGAKGLRMIQKSGISGSSTVREVTSFKSIVRFDEDHLHQKLQNVQPDPNNPDAWFESRDHWFWTGIENGAAKNEVTVKFPSYDLAQGLLRPGFKIELVGCTNYEHNVMISVNGYRIGEEAIWERQDIFSYDGQMPSNALEDGLNELRLTRIGTNPNDGENKDSYPYQFYLNWFEISYIRKLMAVNDRLDILSPDPKEPNTREVNRYSIGGFMNKNIEIFQIDGDKAISKFTDLAINQYILDQEEMDRANKIRSIQYAGDSIFDIPKIPDTAYNVTFDDQGGRSSKYIAVSSSNFMRPDRIEPDVPSSLKDPTNQADYIIISHPLFIDAANELASWRSGAKGGGFRTKVIDVTDIYDEFGFGMVNPKAIKDFLKFAYNNWAEPTISYVLIFGDATYDFLGINEDIYENAPELIGFIPSFYIWTTFGQTAVDHWYSTIDGDDGFPDIYLGRIPVENDVQARSVMDKIIANETGNTNGPWRKQIVSVADDDTHAAGDEIFQIGLEEIWRDYTPLGYDTEKIYLKEIIKEFEQNDQGFARPGIIAEERIKEAFDKGAVIAQYAGHGGRHVWAHEIIFSITDIEELKEIDTYPLLLVLSCYNGYFDLPGELSMAEGMLRADKRGIVAMVSATRLTYGTGNVALNRAIFNGIFKDKISRIGHITAKSKIEVLLEEGISWLSQMEEYTLFGDPASRLDISDYEINPQLVNASVNPGKKLELKPGQILTTSGGNPGNFDGDIDVTVELPDGRQLSKKITATNGSYPAVSFNIPADVRGTDGVLKLYGQNANEIAVGGVKFGIEIPVLRSLTYEITGDKIQFYAEINDDAGLSGIKSVNLTWFNSTSRSWTDSPMIFDQQKSLYKLVQPISIASQGASIIYYVEIVDGAGNTVITDEKTIKLSSKANLTAQKESETDISYTYSSELGKWGLSVQVYNTGTEKVSKQIQITAFIGNPDQDRNNVVDSNIKAIGQGTIQTKDWNEDSTVSAFIPVSLSTGRYSIFVWLDPEYNTNHPENVFGSYAEGSETDNISFKILDVAHALLRPNQEGSTNSPDNAVQFSGPAGAVYNDEVMTLSYINEVQKPINQPGVSFIAMPEGKQGGYALSNMPDNESLKFERKASLRMKFDFSQFREEIKKELGLTGISDNQIPSDQREILEQTLKEKASKLSVYLWQDSARKWSSMVSKPVLDSNENLLTNINSTLPVAESNNNYNSKIIGAINIDKSGKPPVDKWSIIFLDSQHFQVEGVNTGILKKGNELYTGTVGEEFYHPATGFRFTIFQVLNSFETGDRFSFSTIETGTIEAEIESTGIYTLMLNNDERTPDIQITVGDQRFADGDVVSPEPAIQILMYDENGVDILSHEIEIEMSKKGGDSIPAKKDEYVINWDANSNHVSGTYWPGILEPGEYYVKVKAYDFNGNPSNKTIKFFVKKEFELAKDSLMNYPNPFEGKTDITFQLSSLADEATIKIYTVSGRLIRTIQEQHVVNFVVIHWDGRDEDGREIANGVYYYKVRLKREGKTDIVEIGKMMKLK